MTPRRQPRHPGTPEPLIIRADFEPLGWFVTYTGREWIRRAAHRYYGLTSLADAVKVTQEVQADVLGMASGYKGAADAREELLAEVERQRLWLPDELGAMSGAYKDLIEAIKAVSKP